MSSCPTRSGAEERPDRRLRDRRLLARAQRDRGRSLHRRVVLSLSDEQVAETKRKLVIPAGTYAGQESRHRHHLAAGVAFTTTAMDDDDRLSADQDLTGSSKARWPRRAVVERRRRGADVQHQHGKIHPGAVRYYTEAGIELTDAQHVRGCALPGC
jgi:TRAP-type uncharacterized transport system substrate-binding protein